MSQINTELGRSSTSLITLDNAENGTYATINVNSAIRPSSTNPAAISEWRGYNHSAAAPTTTTTTTTTTAAPVPFGGGGNDGVTNRFIGFSSASSQYARTGNVAWIRNYTFNTSFSIVMWVRYVSNTGGVDYFFHSRNSNSTSFFDNNIWLRNTGGGMQFGISGQTSGNATILGGFNQPTIGSWVHVAMTYNGSSKAARVYYNGTSVANGTFTTVTFNTASERNIAFGGLAGSTAGNFTNVQFDEVGFYSSELTQANITTIYNNRAHFSLTGTTGLVENWKFNNNGNSSTGTANLTLFNNPTFTNSPGTY
jgi:hypothetical protein